MKCPACGRNAGVVYKCDNCGETRCNLGGCGGTSKAVPTHGASLGQKCWSCKKGKYKKIS